MNGSLPFLSLYRFSPNSQQMKDIEWKSSMPFTVSIFTELTTDERYEWMSAMPFDVSIFTELATDQRHYMEVCYACRCIDLHRTLNRSTTLHGSLLCHSLYRFSPNSQQKKDTDLKSAMPFTVSIFTELSTDERHWMEVCLACHCVGFH